MGRFQCGRSHIDRQRNLHLLGCFLEVSEFGPDLVFARRQGTHGVPALRIRCRPADGVGTHIPGCHIDTDGSCPGWIENPTVDLTAVGGGLRMERGSQGKKHKGSNSTANHHRFQCESLAGTTEIVGIDYSCNWTAIACYSELQCTLLPVAGGLFSCLFRPSNP